MSTTKKDESVVKAKAEKTTEKAAAKEHSEKATKAAKPVHKAKANSSKPKTHEEVKKSIEAKIDMWFEANKEFNVQKLVSASKLMEINANMGTWGKFWNPKMKPFIYANKSNRSYVIDLLKSMVFLDRAYKYLFELSQAGGKILIVGTRGEITKVHVKDEAKRADCFYVNQRWLGGTLTNFKTINRSIIKLNNLLMMQLSGDIKKYSKKEQLLKIKEAEKLGKFFGGIRTMKGLPQALIVVDPVVEHNAVTEAKKLGIPVIALANTNADPTLLDYIIPCNTNSVKTVYLLLSVLVDAICAAKGQPQLVVGKKDDEIVLPEPAKKDQTKAVVSGTKFTKGAAKAEEAKSTEADPVA